MLAKSQFVLQRAADMQLALTKERRELRDQQQMQQVLLT
jgi:hypothetical protein